MTVRLRFPALALLALLATAARAEEAPWDAPELSPPALQAALEQTKERLAGLPEEQKAAWTRPLEERRDLLTKLLATLEERRNGAAPDELARRRERAAARLEELRSGAAVAPGPEPATEQELAQVKLATDATHAAAEAKQRDLVAAIARRQRVEEELKGLPAREADAIKFAADRKAAASDEAGIHLLASAQLAVRAVEERGGTLRVLGERLALLVPLLELERDGARLEADQAQQGLTRAREAFARRLEAERTVEQRAAEEEARRAELERDPIEGFRRLAKAEAGASEAARKSDALSLQNLEGRIEEQRSGAKTDIDAKQRIEERLRMRSGVSGATAELLIRAFQRMQQARTSLERRKLPAVYEESKSNEDERARVQDRILDLELPLDENRDYAALLEKVGPSRSAAAREAFLAARGDLVEALKARRKTLDDVASSLGQLEGQIVARMATLAEISAVVRTKLLWLRNEEPVGLATARGAHDELLRLLAIYGDARLREETAATFREAPLRLTALSLGILLLLVAGGFAGRRIRALQVGLRFRGRPTLIVLQRVGELVLLSAVVPGLLLATSLLLGLAGLPPALEAPATSLLRGLAIVWFFRRLLLRALRDGGLAILDFKVSQPLALQLRVAVGVAAAAAVFLWLPRQILREAPFGFLHLPRLLYTALLGVNALLLMSLLRRNAPLVAAFTHRRGFWHALWGFAWPLLCLGFLVTVAMDVLGYRYGAQRLIGNVLQTFLAALMIGAVYNILAQSVQGIAARVRTRNAPTEGAAEAREISDVVLRQLSRVLGVSVIAAAILLLATFWDILTPVRELLDGVGLFALDGGGAVTLWDFAKALLWIGGGHFLIRNLAGVYEVLLFPLLRETDAGGRFVVFTLSRYAILVAAYTAALATLHFSFSSIGWILAAASVGLGFGLQEIVANFVSGLILLVERPVSVGDVISVGNTAGTVERITIRSTMVTDWDRKVVIVPNKKLITEDLINWTRNDQLLRDKIKVGVAYGSDVPLVMRLLGEVVQSERRIRKDPPPRILFRAFGESSLDFEVWFYSPMGDRVQVISDLHIAIDRRFREAGIEIPFPQRDLHLRSVDAQEVRGALEAPRTQEPPGPKVP